MRRLARPLLLLLPFVLALSGDARRRAPTAGTAADGVDLPSRSSDRGADAALERSLLERFAPVILLAPRERALPANVDWYLARARLDPDPRGDDLELTWDGSTLALLADGMPADPASASGLEELASAREDGSYAAHAGRLDGDLWEILILPL